MKIEWAMSSLKRCNDPGSYRRHRFETVCTPRRHMVLEIREQVRLESTIARIIPKVPPLQRVIGDIAAFALVELLRRLKTRLEVGPIVAEPRHGKAIERRDPRHPAAMAAKRIHAYLIRGNEENLAAHGLNSVA